MLTRFSNIDIVTDIASSLGECDGWNKTEDTKESENPEGEKENKQHFMLSS